MKLAEAEKEIRGAKRPEDLFGPHDNPGRGGKLKYQRLAKVVHPDAGGSDELFALLGRLWDRWERRTNGKVAFTVDTRRAHYEATERLYVGSVANLYDSVKDGQQVLLKIPRDPRNSDLMEREARALKALALDGEERFDHFYPHLLDTLKMRDSDTGKERRLNVLSTEQGNWYTLAEVHQAYSILDPRDVAWMWRRLLHILGYAGSRNVVHGAVLPENVIIEPEKHGLMLVGWSYASTDGQPISAMVKTYKGWYPPEVHDKKTPDAATDIYMATNLMAWLMADRVPRPIRAFIKGCALESQGMRPHYAWKLKDELDELIERLWGPRTFRAFTMPTANN